MSVILWMRGGARLARMSGTLGLFWQFFAV